MLLYAETHMLSRFAKFYQHLKQGADLDQLRRISAVAKDIVLQIDSQASFIAAEFTNSSMNTIKLSINCMVCWILIGVV